MACHIGASIKDAGKKSFAISVLQDEKLVKDIFKAFVLVLVNQCN
jgi:hypothetical protein